MNKYRAHISLFIKILPDKLTSLQLQKVHLREYRAALDKLPKGINQGKKYQSKSLTEILNLTINNRENEYNHKK